MASSLLAFNPSSRMKIFSPGVEGFQGPISNNLNQISRAFGLPVTRLPDQERSPWGILSVEP